MKTVAVVFLMIAASIGAGPVRPEPQPPSARAQETQAPTALRAAVRQADKLLRLYRETGKTEQAKAKLLAHLARCDSVFGKNPGYLLAKCGYLSALGEEKLWREAFELVPDEALSEPRDLRNRISFAYGTRPTATVTLVRRLASDNSPQARSLLVDFVHNSLAQQFAPVTKPTVGDRLDPLLDGLCKPDMPDLCTMTAGLRTWVQAQKVAADTNALEALLQVDVGGYGSYSPRHRLLLAGLAERNPLLRGQAIAIRDRVIAELLPAPEAPDTTVPFQRDRRALKRYWLAFAADAQANAPLARGDDVEGMGFLRLAAEWSADRQDVLVDRAFYERVTLGGRSEYKSPLAQRLEREGSLEEALKVRSDLARLAPTALPELRRLHTLARPGESFDRYWAEQRLQDAPVAPDFTLRSVSGPRIALSSFRGQWVLIDFWGTWCEPCVQDVPETERLYRKLVDAGAKAALVTIAVEDTVKEVRAFMRARQLTYPVLMGNAAVVDRFKVPHYPYRILVSPDGHFMELPNGVDWASQAESVLMPTPVASRTK